MAHAPRATDATRASSFPAVRTRRRHAVPELGVLHEVDAVLLPAVRAHTLVLEGAVAEDRLLLRGFDRAGKVDRVSVTVVLDGTARLSVGGRSAWVQPGDLAMAAPMRDLAMRVDGSRRYRSVVLEWDVLDAKNGPSLVTGRLAEPDVSRLRAAAWALGDPSARPAAALSQVWRALRAIGAGVPLPRSCPPSRSDRWERVSAALDVSFSSLDRTSGLTEVADRLGVTERHCRRLVHEFNRAYGLNTQGTWRDASKRRRVMMAALTMTARGATTEVAAKSTGYGSAAALCRAFEESGLPSPSRIGSATTHLA